MKKFIDIIKKLFGRKEQVFIIEIEDLKEYISDKSLFCESCHKAVTNLKEISRVTIKNKQIYIHCIHCKGE